MNALLQNKCIKYVAKDEEANGQTGEVGFLNGETFDGEIREDRPHGTGKLHLADGCFYQGNFDSTGITEGKFVHTSFNYYEGSFVRDRFKKGRIVFSDGDVLEGEWGMDKGKWGVKWCKLISDEGKVIGKLNRNGGDLSIKSKNKEVFKSYRKFGFCVVFKKSSSLNVDDPERQLFTAEGTTFDEKRVSKNEEVTVEKKTCVPIPHSKTEEIKEGKLKKSILQTCFGMLFEKEEGEKEGKLTFKDFKGVHGEGEIQFGKLKFVFEGDLFLKEENLGSIIIKKNSFSKLSIRMRGEEFRCVKEFFEFVKALCKDEFNDTSISLPDYPTERKKSIKSQEAMKEMIDDIKKHNECMIM